MSKPSPNIPSIGDRVKLRGRNANGELRHISMTNWTIVHWDTFKGGPGIVHLRELEKI